MRAPCLHIAILTAFLANTFGPVPIAQAQDFHLPVPGVMVHLSPPLDPPILKGIKVHPDNPFRFDFILDKGDSVIARSEATKQSQQEQLKTEATKLIKYFLASLTIPEKDLWVNLSPYEKDRIIPQSFGLTEMGRDLLAEDYILKQVTASLIYPEGEIGKKFWKRIYEQAAKRYGTTNIPVNTFNKVWIVPDKAVVYENAKAGTAYVVESKLKVMLEQDYLSLEKHEGIQSKQAQIPPLFYKEGVRGSSKDISALGSQIIREIVIPELTKEVNENKNFAQLRQVYNSLILATWYKKKIKESILAQVYGDKNKVAGIQYNSTVISGSSDIIPAKAGIHFKNDVEALYQEYLKAFKKGVFNYIKEEPGLTTEGMVPRKYFSGGFFGGAINRAMVVTQNSSLMNGVTGDNAMIIEMFVKPYVKMSEKLQTLPRSPWFNITSWYMLAFQKPLAPLLQRCQNNQLTYGELQTFIRMVIQPVTRAYHLDFHLPFLKSSLSDLVDMDDLKDFVGAVDVQILIPRGFVIVEGYLARIIKKGLVTTNRGRSVPSYVVEPLVADSFGQAVANENYIYIDADHIRMTHGLLQRTQAELENPNFRGYFFKGRVFHEDPTGHYIEGWVSRNFFGDGRISLEDRHERYLQNTLAEETHHSDLLNYMHIRLDRPFRENRPDDVRALIKSIFRHDGVGAVLANRLEERLQTQPAEIVAQSIIELEGKLGALMDAPYPLEILMEPLRNRVFTEVPEEKKDPLGYQQAYELELEVLGPQLRVMNNGGWIKYTSKRMGNLDNFNNEIRVGAQAAYAKVFDFAMQTSGTDLAVRNSLSGLASIEENTLPEDDYMDFSDSVEGSVYDWGRTNQEKIMAFVHKLKGVNNAWRFYFGTLLINHGENAFKSSFGGSIVNIHFVGKSKEGACFIINAVDTYGYTYDPLKAYGNLPLVVPLGALQEKYGFQDIFIKDLSELPEVNIRTNPNRGPLTMMQMLIMILAAVKHPERIYIGRKTTYATLSVYRGEIEESSPIVNLAVDDFVLNLTEQNLLEAAKLADKLDARDWNSPLHELNSIFLKLMPSRIDAIKRYKVQTIRKKLDAIETENIVNGVKSLVPINIKLYYRS